MSNRRSLADLLLRRQTGGSSRNSTLILNSLSNPSGLGLSESLEFNQESHSSAVTDVALDSEERRYLLAGLGDGTLCIHNIFSERKKCGYKSSLELRIGRNSSYKHTHSINTVSWYSDNGMFLSSGRDGVLKVWDSNEGVVVEQFTVGTTVNKHSICAPEVGALVAIANETNHVQLVDLNTGSTCHTLRGHEGEVLTCTWSKLNPRVLATGAADNKIILWDVRQARSYLAYLDFNDVRFKRTKDIRLSGTSHQSSVHGLEFSVCGRYLFSIGKDNRIRKWDTVTLKNLKTKFPEIAIKGKGNVPMSCLEGGDVDYLLLPHSNNIQVYDTRTGCAMPPLVGHYGSVFGMVYSPEDLTLYSCGRDRFILAWDTPLHREAARTSKMKETEGEDTKDINPFTVDAWSSDEEQ